MQPPLVCPRPARAGKCTDPPVSSAFAVGRWRGVGLVCLAMLAACGEQDPEYGAEPELQQDPVSEPAGLPLSPVARLIRASVTLRGVRPSVEEMAAVEADPDQIASSVDRYLEDPGFGTVIRDLHNETMFMTTPMLGVPARGPLAGEEMNRILSSLEESALRLAAHVVVDDLPYTDIVTADYTMANDVVAHAWVGLEDYDFEAPEEWQAVRWSDGRPAAGILSDSSLWYRTGSPERNYNRRRANYVSRTLLCADFLNGDVSVEASVALSNPEDTTPLVNNPVCASCHANLDPLASFLPFDRSWSVAGITWPMELFTESGPYWEDMSGQAPAYFGVAGNDLSDLGRMISEDPRFASCTVRRFYSYLAQVPLDQVEPEILDDLQEVLLSSGWSAKALIRAVVMHPSMQLADVKRSRPEQLATTIEAFTGYRWETWTEDVCCGVETSSTPLGYTDLLRNDLVGYRSLAGGVDSYAKLEPTHTTNSTSALVLRQLATDAAAAAVEHDFAMPDDARLLTLVSPDTDDEDAIRSQLVALRWQLFGERVSGSEVDEDWELWVGSYTRSGSVAHAWTVTLTGLLQTFDLAFY